MEQAPVRQVARSPLRNSIVLHRIATICLTAALGLIMAGGIALVISPRVAQQEAALFWSVAAVIPFAVLLYRLLKRKEQQADALIHKIPVGIVYAVLAETLISLFLPETGAASPVLAVIAAVPVMVGMAVLLIFAGMLPLAWQAWLSKRLYHVIRLRRKSAGK